MFVKQEGTPDDFQLWVLTEGKNDSPYPLLGMHFIIMYFVDVRGGWLCHFNVFVYLRYFIKF